MRRMIGIMLCAVLLCGVGGAAFGAPKDEVVFGDQSWDSIQFHHRVMAYLLEHGYGMKPAFNFSESMPALIGLERGDNHIILEVWTEARQEWWDKARGSGKVREFGKVFPDAPSGLYIPAYLVKGDPERGIEALAPDLVSIFDLPKYQHLFKDPEDPSKGRVYNAASGWKANERHEIKFKGYMVEGKPLVEYFNLFDPGSQTALSAAIKGAYQKGEPIVAYYWEPTPLLGELEMILLKEPEYDEKIFRETQLCQNPAFSVEKAANAAWLEEHPEAEPLLKKYFMGLDKTNEVLAWMQGHGNNPDKAAVWFLQTNPDLWQAWIEDPQVVQAVTEALAKEK